MTLRDHRVTVAADVGFNYFLRPEDMGKKRAECAYKRVQEMNPLGSVACSVDAPVKDLERLKELIKGFDVVILGLTCVSHDFELAAAINAACRSTGGYRANRVYIL